MHVPVLMNEVLDVLRVRDGGVYADATVGGGGHALAILQKAGVKGTLLAMDRDFDAIDRVKTRLAGYAGQMSLVHANYSEIAVVAKTQGIGPFDGVLMDLGVSSFQIDDPERGFSFMREGPLDMRMDRRNDESVADLIARLAEDDLSRIIFEYGEETKSRRIAAAIKRALKDGKLSSTTELAEVVEQAAGGRSGRIHPATKTFQALRIAVNGELSCLEQGLAGALGILKTGGRLAVIAFHSLEDRIVKNFFKDHAGRWESLQQGGERWVGTEPKVRILTRKPVVAGDAETDINPRARSAKLRCAERI